jgi:CheY-like chemotaxis protein
MKLLIIDDEPAITDTLAYALAAEGYATDCCALGREAIAQAAAQDYALVILDVGLPDMNGFDVCRELRRHSDVPVIFLTARAGPGGRRHPLMSAKTLFTKTPPPQNAIRQNDFEVDSNTRSFDMRSQTPLSGRPRPPAKHIPWAIYELSLAVSPQGGKSCVFALLERRD